MKKLIQPLIQFLFFVSLMSFLGSAPAQAATKKRCDAALTRIPKTELIRLGQALGPDVTKKILGLVRTNPFLPSSRQALSPQIQLVLTQQLASMSQTIVGRALSPEGFSKAVSTTYSTRHTSIFQYLQDIDQAPNLPADLTGGEIILALEALESINCQAMQMAAPPGSNPSAERLPPEVPMTLQRVSQRPYLSLLGFKKQIHQVFTRLTGSRLIHDRLNRIQSDLTTLKAARPHLTQALSQQPELERSLTHNVISLVIRVLSENPDTFELLGHQTENWISFIEIIYQKTQEPSLQSPRDVLQRNPGELALILESIQKSLSEAIQSNARLNHHGTPFSPPVHRIVWGQNP